MLFATPAFPITAITRDVGDFGDRRALRAHPTPLGLNYDSKGVIAFYPGKFALNRPRIPSHWP